MVSPFETTIMKLQELGFFTFFLPFILTSAIFYGLLRKSQVFGKPEENVVVNAIVAIVASMMVWAYPVIAGVGPGFELSLTTFFFQGTIAAVVVVFGLMIAGLFLPPDLPAKIGEAFKSGKSVGIIIVAGLLIAAGIFLSSGISSVFGIGSFGGGGGVVLDDTTISTIIIIVILVGSVAAIVGLGGKK